MTTRTALFQQIPDRLSDVVHLDLVVRLLPEDLAVGGSDHEAVCLEAKVLDDFLVLRRRRVHVLRLHASFELFFQPAHGGLDLGADGSAGEVVVGDLERRGLFRGTRECRKRDRRRDKE